MSLARQSALLGVAGVVEYAAQLVLPVILVRHLTQSEFGDYRLFWLIAGSAVAVFPFFLPQSLFYLLPRNDGPARARLFGNTLTGLLILGGLAAAFFAVAVPYLSEPVAMLVRQYPATALFAGLWVAASLFDTLALADGRAGWQARTAIALSVTRTGALGAAAVLAGDLGSVFAVGCLFAAVKLLLAFAYACRAPDRNELQIDPRMLIEQLKYAAPFALGNAIFALRTQADQWVVASLFSSDVFAIFSVGAVALSVATLVRQPITNALLPRVSDALTRQDLAAAVTYIRKGSLAIQLFSLPLFAWLYMVAPDLVTLVYTAHYRDAADVLRAYVVGLSLATLGAGYLLPVLNLGRQALLLNAFGLLVSVAVSYFAASSLGYLGAVAGSMLSLVLMEYWALILVARRLNTPVAKLYDARVTVRTCSCIGLGMIAAFLGADWLERYGPAARILASSLAFVAVCALVGKQLNLVAEAKRVLGRLDGDGNRGGS